MNRTNISSLKNKKRCRNIPYCEKKYVEDEQNHVLLILASSYWL